MGRFLIYLFLLPIFSTVVNSTRPVENIALATNGLQEKKHMWLGQRDGGKIDNKNK